MNIVYKNISKYYYNSSAYLIKYILYILGVSELCIYTYMYQLICTIVDFDMLNVEFILKHTYSKTL